MKRFAAVLAFVAAAALGQDAAKQEPSFAKVPFDEWLSGEGHSVFLKWNARVLKPELSFHQRLLAQVEVLIDGKELSKLRGEGDLLIYVQIRDEQDRHYRASGSISLSKLDENIRKAEISYTHSMFILPGDYRLDVAIVDSNTQAHSVKQSRFHVAALRDDPLPGSWKDLPRVEFTSSPEPPESWFLPEITSRLDLSAGVKKPLRIDIVANMSATETTSRSRNAPNANLGALLPTLKTLANAGSEGVTVNVEVLDLVRQKVALRAKDVRELGWASVKNALEESSSGKIDLKSLEGRHQRAAFVTGELARVIGEDSKTPRVVVVLTNAVTFEGGTEPIRATLPANCRLVYIRVRPRIVQRRGMLPDPGFRGRRLPPPRMPNGRGAEADFDQLEPLLKSLHPEVMDVEVPDQARKAIARVLGLE